MFCGVIPACSSPSESAIEKQPARAAPIISSGLEPLCPSKRVPTEKGTSGVWSPFIVPRPPLSVPSQVPFALLVDMMVTSGAR